MNKRIDTRDFEEVRHLLHDEIDEAIVIFRSRDSEKRLRSRISADDRPVGRKPLLMKIAVPAGAVLLLVMTLTIVLLVTDRSPAPGPTESGLFAAVLGQFPSLSRTAAGPVPDSSQRGWISGASRGFERAIASAGRLEEKEEGRPVTRTGNLRVPTLSMKERMEILFKDKVIEHALMSLAAKSKEA